jgi:type VI secretion system secreted protein Hcp
MPRFVFAAVAAVAVLANAAPASAQEIFCTIVAAKQGTIQGGSTGAKTASQIPVLFLTEEVTRTFDAASGLATGTRTHKPLTIVKELDAASPKLFLAAVTNETLRSVTCTFYRDSRNGIGEMHAYFRITLTNAAIVDYKDAGDGSNGTAAGDERERISFTYQRIELIDLDSNSSAEDDWLSGGT